MLENAMLHTSLRACAHSFFSSWHSEVQWVLPEWARLDGTTYLQFVLRECFESCCDLGIQYVWIILNHTLQKQVSRSSEKTRLMLSKRRRVCSTWKTYFSLITLGLYCELASTVLPRSFVFLCSVCWVASLLGGPLTFIGGSPLDPSCDAGVCSTVDGPWGSEWRVERRRVGALYWGISWICTIETT